VYFSILFCDLSIIICPKSEFCDNELNSLRLLGVTSRTNLSPTLLRYAMCSDREENVIDLIRITFTQYINVFIIKNSHKFFNQYIQLLTLQALLMYII
jgi:hypothetical protein